MTNEQQVQAVPVPREIMAAEPRRFWGQETFDKWLDRWSDNNDEAAAIGLLHALFEGEPVFDLKRRTVFVIRFLVPLDCYGGEHEPLERIQRKAAATVAYKLLKKRDHDLESLALLTLKKYPEIVPGFLGMLASRQKGYDRPKFFEYDERDSSTKLIQSFLRECHRVLRGTGIEGRQHYEFQPLREALAKERVTFYRLLLDYRLEKLCGIESVAYANHDAINDPANDLMALEAIALSSCWGRKPQTIGDALLGLPCDRTPQREAAIQHMIISGWLEAQRRAHDRARAGG